MITTTAETVETVVTIQAHECGACGVVFGMSETFITARRNDHQTWYCPNGHPRVFNSKSEAEKLTERLAREKGWRESAEARNTALQDQLDATERSRSALKGHLTRARNKIANGVCPVGNCRRHFDNVQEHIASEHPQWHVTDPETGKAAVL